MSWIDDWTARINQAKEPLEKAVKDAQGFANTILPLIATPKAQAGNQTPQQIAQGQYGGNADAGVKASNNSFPVPNFANIGSHLPLLIIGGVGLYFLMKKGRR